MYYRMQNTGLRQVITAREKTTRTPGWRAVTRTRPDAARHRGAPRRTRGAGRSARAPPPARPARTLASRRVGPCPPPSLSCPSLFKGHHTTPHHPPLLPPTARRTLAIANPPSEGKEGRGDEESERARASERKGGWFRPRRGGCPGVG